MPDEELTYACLVSEYSMTDIQRLSGLPCGVDLSAPEIF